MSKAFDSNISAKFKAKFENTSARQSGKNWGVVEVESKNGNQKKASSVSEDQGYHDL